jgi:G:T/U-mismatch repair DNA glycosylase
MAYKRDIFEIEDHPFGNYIPQGSKYLIVGTFPTHRRNFAFDFFYSGGDNVLWGMLGKVFGYSFEHAKGEEAVAERKQFLEKKGIGMTDMLEKCYRKNNFSTDENLFPIKLMNIFSLLDKHETINRLILTSRGDVIGALGLLKTYFLQNNLILDEPKKRSDRIVEGNFAHRGREIDILVPYSPSPRVTEKNLITPAEHVQMYRSCFK